MKTFEMQCDPEQIAKAVDFIRDALKEKGVPQKKIIKAALSAEEVLVQLIAHAPEEKRKEQRILIEAGGFFGEVSLRFKAKGSEFTLAELKQSLSLEDLGDEDANNVVLRLMEKLLGDDLSIKNAGGTNRVTMQVKKSHYAGLLITLACLVLGVATGLFMQNAFPAEISSAISANLFTPVYTMFMNGLKMIVAPLVFCSVAASIADFGDLKALGRIALRIVLLYVCTSAIAIFIGFAAYQIFPIGDPSLAEAVSLEEAEATLAKGENVTISIKDTIVGIIPSDIITPFQKSEMLQLIFMAVMLGIAASAIAKKMPEARNLLVVLNEVCSRITAALVRFIPLVVFCSMAKMMLSMNLGHLMNVAVWVPVIYFGDILMICAYLVLLLLLGGLNPLKFLKGFYPAMVSAFVFSSSNAALPSSMKQCEQMGISSRVYSFSLPLGATINMDGSCISLMVSALFFAKIFSIPVSGSVLLSLFISIIVLSLGSPGVPGGNLVCIALLVPQIGVPAEAISLVMGLYPIVSMMQTCANVTGDAVVTAIVAKREKLLDAQKYNAV